MSALLTKEVCARFWEHEALVIRRLEAAGVYNRDVGVVVVLNPVVPWHPDAHIQDAVTFTAPVAGSLGDVELYRQIAVAKAELSWRTGQSSRWVQQNAPHLYMIDDVKFGGSVVLDGLIVAFSGVQAHYDEAIALSFAAKLAAYCRQQMVEIMAAERIYIPSI